MFSTSSRAVDVDDAAVVVVADTLVHSDGGVVRCPSAALVEGELHRRGIRTVRRALPIPPPCSIGSGHSAGPLSIVMTSGRQARTGLGVAVPDRDPRRWQAAESALVACASVAGPRTLLLASPRSFCAGVERAIETVRQLLARTEGTLYVRKQIVHNAHVVAELRAQGAVFVEELDEVPAGSTVVFSAHGVSPAVHAEARRRRLTVVDATCPLVTKVHVEARRFARRGDTVVLIGHAGHEEVDGTLGEAPEQTVLVETVADVRALEVEDPNRVSYLMQTTLAVDETTEIVDALRSRFPALRGPGAEDICYATTNRQDALRGIAQDADLVLVVGSRNSSNSQRLVDLAKRLGTPAHLIDSAADIDPSWLSRACTIGLTAGASAPPTLVDEVISVLRGLGPVTVSERVAAEETVQFLLPPTVRPA